MALTRPPDSPSSYYPPAMLSWRIQDLGIYIEIPLSIDLCDALEDEDITAIGETVEARLKARYPSFKIARVVSWKPTAPPAETLIVVQEGQPPEPSPDQPAPEEPAPEDPTAEDPAPEDAPTDEAPPEQGQ